ncbi:GlxA family transcriptional regulator [Acuticoccus kandeliae]|uniref:GlxA family transcriptional regulator n=1 Tax=Acuticoccus kandeliae TaxID=2073160 RepID=UPI000D3E21EC|nr:helix-turn-helix domain-containing protein [Acuticoccus kandeliae]
MYETACPQFNFILQPEFPLNALILASDALRIANQNSGREVFRWSFVSETGDAVRASNGMWFAADTSLAEMPVADVCLVFEGNLPTQRNTQRLLGALRAAARFGTIVGGVDTGAFALAQAGLLGTREGADIVLHWEAVPTFMERFPTAVPRNRIYLVEAKTVHCAGGVATLDLILDLIARFDGEALANEVANALVHTRREATTAQRLDGFLETEENRLSARMISVMEKNLDFPLTLDDLAEALDVSARTITRICGRTFGQSPMRLYLKIRLQAARNLLFYEEHSIKDVATACGFSYPAVFSRVFKAQFGQTPRAFRAALRERQSLAVRPEIHRLISRAETRPG